jgi:catechol 2,3-dioxygenase-like lactoylglutathione lyase family enzyme
LEPESILNVRMLDHVTLVVKNLARSREFYAGILGMRPIERPNFPFDGSWFQSGKTQIHLILEHPESEPAGNGANSTSQAAPTRRHHIAFAVEDAHAAAESLRRRDVPIVSGPKLRPDGAAQVFVADPDGHLVEICSAPPK